MIKLSLNSPDSSKQQNLAAAAPFSSALAAAVEAASAQPEQTSLAQAAVKKQPKQVQTPVPSNGLLSRSVRWLQQRGSSKKRLHMIETVSLGEKRFVALVKVDGREFLLGGAPSSVGMLADLGAHGLGELLSVATTVNANVEQQTFPSTGTTEAAPEALPFAAVTSRPEVSTTDSKAEVIEPFALSLPEVTAGPVQQTASVTPTKISVVVTADDDEADSLLEDEMENMLKSAVAVGPSSNHKTFIEPLLNVRPEPVHTEAIEIQEKLGPVAVPSPIPAVAPASSSRMDLNFTFQMWPTAQATTHSMERSTSSTAPADLRPVAAAPKGRTHIDLECSPELLGEPYVLALLDGAQGVAA